MLLCCFAFPFNYYLCSLLYSGESLCYSLQIGYLFLSSRSNLDSPSTLIHHNHLFRPIPCPTNLQRPSFSQTHLRLTSRLPPLQFYACFGGTHLTRSLLMYIYPLPYFHI